MAFMSLKRYAFSQTHKYINIHDALLSISNAIIQYYHTSRPLHHNNSVARFDITDLTGLINFDLKITVGNYLGAIRYTAQLVLNRYIYIYV